MILKRFKNKTKVMQEKDGGEGDGNEEKESANEKEEDKITKTSSYEELSPGQGTVTEDRKVACLQRLQRRTTSLFCSMYSSRLTVTWNNSEKSFGCPCHGSRFSANSGNVINGPANSGIESKKTELM